MRRILWTTRLLATAALAACAPTAQREAADVATTETAAAAAPAFDHAADVEAWRTARLARLQKPDGWLSLIGLHWLVEGEQTLGHAAGNDIERLMLLAADGRLDEAARMLYEEHPFPATLGRVCPHPCETACNRSAVGASRLIRARSSSWKACSTC